jgi:hypothetical protein
VGADRALAPALSPVPPRDGRPALDRRPLVACLFCRYKLGLAPWQERALAAAVSDPQPEPSAALLAEYALLALRVTPVGY